MEDLTKYKEVMMEAADEAAEIILRYYKTDIKIGRKKFYSDLVTEADRESEEKIAEIIHRHYPGHNILGEEGGDREKNSDYVWIVDPIDGTVNFAHSLPLFCISIALEIKGRIMLGVVYNPVTREKYFASSGNGAYLNGEKISVSSTDKLKDGFLVTGFAYNVQEEESNSVDHFVNFVRMGLPVRRLGSAALDICCVASGIFDAFWEVNLNAWDVAAGYLVLLEAGGRVTDFKGGDYTVYGKQILATNGRNIHNEMIEVLQKAENK